MTLLRFFRISENGLNVPRDLPKFRFVVKVMKMPSCM